MRLYLLIGFLLGGLSSAASAQIEGSRSGISSSMPLGNVSAFRELQRFGECVAKTERKTALALIGTPPDSDAESKAFKKHVFGEDKTICLAGGTKMTLSLIYARGAIAEGLLRSTQGIPETFRLAAPPATDTRTLHDVARCYSVGNRDQVLTVLKTAPGSKEEVKAVAAIWPGFRTCMPGFQVRLNAPWIRFLLAEAMLRLDPTGIQ